MDSREKTKKDDKSTERSSGFPFGDCEEMFEKMSECCGDMSKLFDCCSMMEKMKDEKSGKSKKE
jgi:hypothetical protein